ncbi:MAG: hypothetical protein U1E65_02465 [Myxococcota bacterium]
MRRPSSFVAALLLGSLLPAGWHSAQACLVPIYLPSAASPVGDRGPGVPARPGPVITSLRIHQPRQSGGGCGEEERCGASTYWRIEVADPTPPVFRLDVGSSSGYYALSIADGQRELRVDASVLPPDALPLHLELTAIAADGTASAATSTTIAAQIPDA